MPLSIRPYLESISIQTDVHSKATRNTLNHKRTKNMQNQSKLTSKQTRTGSFTLQLLCSTQKNTNKHTQTMLYYNTWEGDNINFATVNLNLPNLLTIYKGSFFEVISNLVMTFWLRITHTGIGTHTFVQKHLHCPILLLFSSLWGLDVSHLNEAARLFCLSVCVCVCVCVCAGQIHGLIHVQPALSPTRHAPSHLEGRREQASHRTSDQRASDRSVKALWKDIHSYTSWHACTCFGTDTDTHRRLHARRDTHTQNFKHILVLNSKSKQR